MQQSEFKFGVGQQYPAWFRVCRSAPVDTQADIAYLLGPFASNQRGSLLERNVLIVSRRSLSGRRKDRLWQSIGFAQPRRQLDSANMTTGAVILPPRTRNIAAHHALD